MKKLSLLLCLSAIFIFTAAACKKKPQPGYATFKLDEIFDLKLNQSTQLEGGDLKITFTAVTEDSRCPKGVNCIQEGQISIALAVASASQSNTLSFTRRASQTDNINKSFENYKIQWLAVTPYPEDGKKIKPEDYNLRIAVRQGK